MDSHLTEEDLTDRDNELNDVVGTEVSMAVDAMVTHAAMTNDQYLIRALDLITFCSNYGDPAIAGHARATLISMLAVFVKQQQRGR